MRNYIATYIEVSNKLDAEVLWNIGYPYETHLKLKSRENIFVYNIHLGNLNLVKILHRTWPYHCHDLSKILKQLDKW